MGKPRRHRLKPQAQGNCLIFGIASAENDYRVAWSLNKSLGLELGPVAPLEATDERADMAFSFSVFEFEDESRGGQWRLVSNRCEGLRLVPRQRDADYFLVCAPAPSDEVQAAWLRKLREGEGLQTAFVLQEAELGKSLDLLF